LFKQHIKVYKDVITKIVMGMKVIKQGNSYYILVPSWIVKDYGINGGENVKLRSFVAKDKRLILSYEIELKDEGDTI
jgi:hypothetical protein